MPKYAKLPDASDDFGHEETDRILGRMEKKISKEYKQTEKELTEKLEKYLERFEAKDKAMRQKLAEGAITQDEYNRWRIGQVATGDRWKAMRDTIAEEITKANDIAKSTINSHAEEVYSLNHNYAVYQAEKDAMIDTSYTLYNRRATEELFKNKKSLLPAPKEGSKAWKAAHDKDLRWNQQKINSSLIQGLLQGDSIPQIAKRLKDVVGMNKVSAVRNARTMTTGVENRARDDAVNDLRKKGIELDSVWIATLDNRTRHSHRLLHGEIKNLKTGKYSNGCRYPADPQGKPEEVYNCRCSQRSNVRGFPIDIPKWSPKMGDMTFEEWLGEHSESVSVAEKKTSFKFGKMVSDFTPAKTREEAEKYADRFVSRYKSKYSGNVSYKGIDVEYANASNRVLTEVFQRYNIGNISDILPMNKRENRWKDTTADAAYQWGGSGGRLFFNASYYKNKKALEAHINEGKDLLSTVLNGVDVLLKKDLSERKRNYIEALVESKCQCVAQKLPKEEYATCTVVHECGHMLDDHFFSKIFKEQGFDVFESMNQYGKKISGYAISSRQEYIAESFASYWYGLDIDPALEKIFKEAEKYGR